MDDEPFPGAATVVGAQHRVHVVADPGVANAQGLHVDQPVDAGHAVQRPVQAAVEGVRRDASAHRPADLPCAEADGVETPDQSEADPGPALAAVGRAIQDGRAAAARRIPDGPTVGGVDEGDVGEVDGMPGLHGEGEAAVRGAEDVAAADQPAVRGIEKPTVDVGAALRQRILPAPAAVAGGKGRGRAGHQEECQPGRCRCDRDPDQGTSHESLPAS